MNSNLIASLEQLENLGAFHDFCKKLDEDYTETIKAKLRDSQKISAEDYAKADIYYSLKDMPKKLRIALSNENGVKKQKQSDVYESLEDSSSKA